MIRVFSEKGAECPKCGYINEPKCLTYKTATTCAGCGCEFTEYMVIKHEFVSEVQS